MSNQQNALKEKCKLASLHEKFNQAFILWKQTYENYFNPDIFITNLNATIQALRNITFTLQNKKSLFADFDKWYQPWVEKLKADKYMCWLNDSRIKIVHQDDFEVNSFATIRVFNYYTTYLADYSIPIEMPLEAIIGMLLYYKKITPEQIKAENILEVTRRWSAPDYKKIDILYILLCTFPVFSNIIADAHKELGLPIKECEYYIKENNQNFPETLISLIDNYCQEQTRCYSLKDLHPMDVDIVAQNVTLEQCQSAVERYDQVQTIFEKKHDAEIYKIIDMAKYVLSVDGYHSPMAFLTDVNNKKYMTSLLFDTRADKYVVFSELAKNARINKVVHAIIIVESYMILPQGQEQFLKEFDATQIKDKYDCLNIYEITPTNTLAYIMPFKKMENNSIIFEEMRVEDDFTATFITELKTVIDENAKKGK